MTKKHEKTEFFLFIVRHAHRHTLDLLDSNNGLSEKGLKQASHLWGHYKDLHKKFAIPLDAVHLYSSPKRRCQETLKPLANHLKLPVTILDLLDEGGNLGKKCRMIEAFIHEKGESNVVKGADGKDGSSKDGSKATGLHQVSGGADCVVLCSHGDVIPELLDVLCGVSIQLSKSGSVLLKWNSDSNQFDLLQVDQ